MGSEHSTESSTSTTTTTNNISYTTTNNYTTNNHTTNNTYHIPITISQQFNYTVPTTLKPYIPERSPITHSDSKSLDYSHGYDHKIYATSDHVKESSTMDKKQYLRSALVHCKQRPVRYVDMRRTFERNQWKFKQDDFDDIYDYLLTIDNPRQRLDSIQLVHNCLEENIKFKLNSGQKDVDIFCHFQGLINDLVQTTTETANQEKCNSKRFDHTEQRREQFHRNSRSGQVSFKRSNASETLPYYDIDEQRALYDSLH